MGVFTTIGAIVTAVMFGMTVTDNASFDTLQILTPVGVGFGVDVIITIIFFVVFFGFLHKEWKR